MDFRELMQWGQGRSGYDWSAGPSGLRIDDVRQSAVEALQDFLRESGEPSRLDLADRDLPELLRQLQLLRADATLTRAGALLLCASPVARVAYLHRPAAGVRSVVRAERAGQGLAEELRRVLDAFEANNAIVALSTEGLAQGAVSELPELAFREALINAVMHRDWELAEPVIVEHVGSSVTVQSPGGFFGGVTADTVLTAASVTRNRRLGDALRSIRVAEREGIGVDRMFIEMVRLGHSPPAFAERDGGVRVALQGGPPEPSVLQAHAKLPPRLREDARMSVAIDLLRKKPSITAAELATAAQQPETDLAPFLQSAEEAGVLRRTARPRPGGLPAWRLNDEVRSELGSVLPYYSRPAEQAIEEISRLAREQGNVRNKDVQDLLGVSPNRASDLLTLAAQEGLIQLADGAKPTGRGTYYVPSG
jgi:ATP-dependent DNA helicase RecG